MTLYGHLTDHKYHNLTVFWLYPYSVQQPAGIDNVKGLRVKGNADDCEGVLGLWINNFTRIDPQEVA